MIELELRFKDEVLKRIEMDKAEITIGRSPNADIQIGAVRVYERVQVGTNPSVAIAVD